MHQSLFNAPRDFSHCQWSWFDRLLLSLFFPLALLIIGLQPVYASESITDRPVIDEKIKRSPNIGMALAPTLPATPVVDADGSWLSKAQKELAEREYQASHNGTGLQSPNRAHNLRIYYTEQGIQVHDRTAKGEPLLLGMQLSSYGRGEAVQQIKPSKPQHQGNRVTYVYDGDIISEWYDNSAKGLEHGFTLHQRPQGKGQLKLAIALRGAQARTASNDVIQLKTDTGRILDYKALKVIDAEGQTVEAHMGVKNNYILLSINDHQASWPLTVDPLLTGVGDGMLESNQENANLGISVAGAGDVNGDGYSDVIVGASLYDNGQPDEGAAFVYHGGISGISGIFTQLESNQASANFGISVAGVGDVNGDGYSDVIVGASLYGNGEAEEGAAFVYYGGVGGVDSAVSTQLESNQISANFGISVSGAGDVNGDGYSDVIVGASLYDNGQPDEGAAFVYYGGVGGVDSAVSTLLEADLANANFGISVSGAGDVNDDGHSDVIVGASLYSNGEANEGAAFVYYGAAVSGINPAASTQLESNQASANFGISVVGAGDVNGDGYSDVIVGASLYDNGEADEGAAFVYHGGAGGVSTTIGTQLESNLASANFGISVSGAGDVNGDGYSDVIVGASLYESDVSETDEGAAFVYHGGAGGVSTTISAQLESNLANANFGISVAGAGDVNGDGYSDVIVGASLYESDVIETDEGAAFVYHGGASGTSLTASTLLEANQASANFGISVSGAGDVNGDGYSDVIVGAHEYDNGQDGEGVAFVYHGGASGLSMTASTLLEANQGRAKFGSSVSGAGDVNGDGYSDVIVGAPFYDNDQAKEGAAFVYHGGAGGVSTTISAQLESNQAFANFGISVAGAGDVNGDGYSDVIVGAYAYDNGEAYEGAAFVYHGGLGGLRATVNTLLEVNQGTALFGHSVAGAGDVNGDGYSDVIVGASFYDNGETNEGAAFVYHGGVGGVSTTISTQLESNQASANFGISVSGAGDVDGDGYSDVIVGARYYSNGEASEGAAFVYHGAAVSGINPAASTQLEGNQEGAHLGWSVAGAGDVNGDGYSDVVVGANLYTNLETDEGAAFVYYGRAGGVDSTVSTLLEANQAFANFGISVAGAGDVNGDGYSDVIAGASLYDNGEADEGAAFVYYGNSLGRLVQARQYQQDSPITPVQTWGLSYAAGQFTVAMNATHPTARGAVKMQVEYCPSGVAFDDVSCQTDTPINWVLASGASGVVLSQTLSTGVEGLYNWRARVLYADESILVSGIPPVNPLHGPWRRFAARADNGDIRAANHTNVPPFFTSGIGSFVVAEDVGTGTAVTTVVATDPEGATLTYEIVGGNAAGRFAIDATTGQITVAQALDYGVMQGYTLTVRASDGDLSETATVTVNVTDVNYSPLFISGTDLFGPAKNVAENVSLGTEITTVVATDPDGMTPSYDFSNGSNTVGPFAIDAVTGQITVAQALDFEDIKNYILTVRASDGSLSETDTVTVNVTNIEEPPLFISGVGNFALSQNADIDALVTTVFAIDPEGQALDYVITDGNTAELFAMHATTGQITVAQALDSGVAQSYVLTVSASDGLLSGVGVVTVNVHYPPSFTAGIGSFDLAENVSIGTLVTTVIATDPEEEALSYGISAGNTDGRFAMDATTGQVTVVQALDYETTQSYTLTVSASDGSLNETGTVTVNVTDIDDGAPAPAAGGGGGGGCSVKTNAPFDPLLPLMLLVSGIYLWRPRMVKILNSMR